MADQWLDPARMRSASRWSQADLYDPEKKGMELLSESMNAIGRAKDWTPFVSFVVELERTDPSAAKDLLAKVPAGLREHVVNPAVKTMRVERSKAQRALKREPKKTFSGKTKVSSLNIPSSAKPGLEAKAVADTKTTLLMSDLRKANEKEPGTLFPPWVQGGHIHAGSLANLVAVSTPDQREALQQWVEENVKGMEPKQDVDEPDDVDSDDGEATEPEKPKQLSTLQEVFSVVKDTIEALEKEQGDRQSQTELQSEQMNALRTFHEKCIAEPGTYGIFEARDGLPSVTSISKFRVFLSSHSGQRDKVRTYIKELPEKIQPAFKKIEEALDTADTSADLESSLARQPELSPCYSALKDASGLNQEDREALVTRLGDYDIQLYPEDNATHLIIPAKFEDQVESLRKLNDYLASAECKQDALSDTVKKELLAVRLRLVEGVCAHLIADEQDLTHLDPLIDSPVVEEFYGRQRSLGRILMQPPRIGLNELSGRAQSYIKRMQKKQGEALFKELSGVLGDAAKAAYGAWLFSNGALYPDSQDRKVWKPEDWKAFARWMEGSSQWGETNTYHALGLEVDYRSILNSEATDDLSDLDVEALSEEQKNLPEEQKNLLSRLRGGPARSDLCQADQNVIIRLNERLGDKGAVLYGSSGDLTIYGGNVQQRQAVFDQVLKVLSEDTAKTLSRDFTSGLRALAVELAPGLIRENSADFFTQKIAERPRMELLWGVLGANICVNVIRGFLSSETRYLLPLLAATESHLVRGSDKSALLGLDKGTCTILYQGIRGQEWKADAPTLWKEATKFSAVGEPLFAEAIEKKGEDLQEALTKIALVPGLEAAYSQEVALVRSIQVPGLRDELRKLEAEIVTNKDLIQNNLRTVHQELAIQEGSIKKALAPYVDPNKLSVSLDYQGLVDLKRVLMRVRYAVMTGKLSDQIQEEAWSGAQGLNSQDSIFQKIIQLATRVEALGEETWNQQLLAMNAGLPRPDLDNPQTLELQLPKEAAGALLGFLKACQNAKLPVCWIPISQTSGQLQIGDLNDAQRLELRNQLEALVTNNSEDLKKLAADGKGVQVLVQKLWGPLLYQKCGSYDMPTKPQFENGAWQAHFVEGLENKELLLAGGNDELAGILKELHKSCCISDGKLRAVLMGRCVPDAGGQGSYPEELSKIFNNPQVKGDYDPLRIRYFGPDEYKAPLLDKCRMLLEEANGVNNPSRISMLLLIMGALR